MMTTTTPKVVPLSDFGLKPQMTVREILFTVERLKERIGEKVFQQKEKQVCFNLNQMKPGTTFNYRQYFKGENLEIFIVIAHRYIIEYLNYEFSNDYSVIRRTN